MGRRARSDVLEVRVDPDSYVSWPNGGGYQPVTLLVNGCDLIELVRDCELPFAEAEYDARVAEGESPESLGPRGRLAGNYLHLNGSQVFLPSHNLLGAPYPHGFGLEPEDPRNQKSLLLGCTCGITECWFLLARIQVTADVVTWDGFCQFHRSWKYDLGPLHASSAREYE